MLPEFLQVLPVHVLIYRGPQLTLGLCLDECDSQGYRYGGLEAGFECWYGNTTQWDVAQDGRCQIPCTGMSSLLPYILVC